MMRIGEAIDDEIHGYIEDELNCYVYDKNYVDGVNVYLAETRQDETMCRIVVGGDTGTPPFSEQRAEDVLQRFMSSQFGLSGYSADGLDFVFYGRGQDEIEIAIAYSEEIPCEGLREKL